MFGIGLYLAVAVLAAVAIFLAAEWAREPGTPAPDHPGRVSLVAGLLWPVVLMGLAQCALLAAAHNRLAREPVSAERIRSGEWAGTP